MRGDLGAVTDLASGYNIIEKIGTGARSTIYQVVDPRTGQVFALKRVIRDPHEDTRFLDQAIREHEIASQVDNPYIRKSFELKKIRKMITRLTEVQVIMEYVRGHSLESQRPTELGETLNIFLHVAQGLDAIHQAGFLHTDIKPNNIMVCQAGQIKIIDLGQGCPIGEKKQRIQGTPDYIAPEQVHRHPLTQATDVFNYGATLYWALTGKNVPTMINKAMGGVPKGIVNLQMPRVIPTPTELNESIPSPISRLVMDCVAERPADRPRTMGQVISRLEIAQHLVNRRENATPEPEIGPFPEDDSFFGQRGREIP